MYILVKEDLTPGWAALAAAHTSLMVYLRYEKDPLVKDWLDNSFKKVVCTVTDKEFERAKKFHDNVIMTESDLDNKEMAIGFCPRKEWPNAFRHYRLLR